MCSIALPDLPQFRGLLQRLPALAKSRTGITTLHMTPRSEPLPVARSQAGRASRVTGTR